MTRVGLDTETLRPLVGWPHVVQSLHRILETEVGTRVERRDFGSHVGLLLDRPQNEEELIRFYMVVATAIWPRRVRGQWYGEPGFGLNRVRFDASTPGHVIIRLDGVYYPNGHLDDFTISEPAELSLGVTESGFVEI